MDVPLHQLCMCSWMAGVNLCFASPMSNPLLKMVGYEPVSQDLGQVASLVFLILTVSAIRAFDLCCVTALSDISSTGNV